MIPIKGYENYLDFGYIKCKRQELNKYGEEFIKYVMNIIDDGIWLNNTLLLGYMPFVISWI